MAVDIKILGADCPRCKQLAALVDDILKDMDAVDAGFEKVDDMSVIISYGVLAIPGLVINGEVKSAGNVPNRQEIISWIEEARKE